MQNIQQAIVAYDIHCCMFGGDTFDSFVVIRPWLRAVKLEAPSRETRVSHVVVAVRLGSDLQ